MPTYDYECSSCETNYSTFQNIQENIDDPPTHCPKCDPRLLNEKELCIGILDMLDLRFRVNGEGAYDNRMK